MNAKTLTALTFAGLFGLFSSAHAAGTSDNPSGAGPTSSATEQEGGNTTGLGTPDASTSGRGAGVETGSDLGPDDADQAGSSTGTNQN
ncbi:hypothetical protein [Stutzerimonas azotifigens]|uniref:Uncharacterized protein n=1 Tax=Stutzerimonas azotifigens TaxID=291995 RepID=A0ABR5Z066_9GAMM|nr:hypothetical protein [Stutzerimonas azotifigens]MBA1273601.1 hypothetical protein [Stutzerimonas azotifigens]